MPTISRTHTEETDYIVAQQFTIGFINNLSCPKFLAMILAIAANTFIITTNERVSSLQSIMWWI